nr:hypothetical protein CcurKRNrm1_p155 [Cryptomonas curvata]
MFFAFFFIFFREKQILFFNKNKQIKLILNIISQIFLKSNKNFFKKQIFKIKIISIIFFKLIISKVIIFQLIGLKGIFILLKKKYFLDYLGHLIYYISFLSIKSFSQSIKLLCIAIVKSYILNAKNIKFRQNCIQQIFITYLNNQKSLFRLNSLNFILKILLNLNTWKTTKKLNKIFFLVFFHFLFDFDFICRFFSGIICKIIFSLITNKSRILLYKKMFTFRLSINKPIDTRIDTFLDWLYITSTKKKSYNLFKFYDLTRLFFLFKNKFQSYEDLVYLYLKMNTFLCLLVRNREFLNFTSVSENIVFFTFKSIKKESLLIKKKILEIFIFSFKNFFIGYIQIFVYLNKCFLCVFLFSDYKIAKKIKSILKKKIKVLTIFFLGHNFFPSLVKYIETTNPIFRGKKFKKKVLLQIKNNFLKKTDVLLLITILFYIFFNKNVYNSSNCWITCQTIKKHLKKELKKNEYMFYKYLFKIKKILVNMSN